MSKLPGVTQLLRTAGHRTGLAAGQTGRLFRRAAATALQAVQDVLRAEVDKGNLREVGDFLRGKALPAVRVLLLERITARLLVRLGLRGALANTVVGWVLPVVLEQLLKAARQTGVAERLRTSATAQDARQRLDDLLRTARRHLLPDYGTGAEVLPE